MKNDKSRLNPRREVEEREHHANEIALELQKLTLKLDSTLRQRDELQQSLAAEKEKHDQLQDQLDVERTAWDELLEGARILAADARRLDQTLAEVLGSKRIRVGNFFSGIYQQAIPAAIKPHLWNFGKKLYYLASRLMPEGQSADLDVDVNQIRKEMYAACDLLSRYDGLQPASPGRGRTGTATHHRIDNPLDIQISDPLLFRRVRDYQQSKRPASRKVVVYTAISNNYDVLKIPEVLCPDWDYVCFTDRERIPGDHPWILRPFNFLHLDNTRTARYVKLHPHVFFPDYEYSVWIDANILIKSDFLAAFTREFMEKDGLFAAIPHPLRNCTYEEGEQCVRRAKDAAKVIEKQMSRYHQAGFPEHAGLIETQILLREHNHELVRRVNDDWWKEVDQGSRRDQLSLMYVLWKNAMEWTPLITEGLSTRNHEGFRFFQHGLEHNHRDVRYRVPKFLPKSFATDRQPFWTADLRAFDPSSTKPLENDRIDIVVCVHNSLADVRKCLESVASTRLPTHRIIIIDDGSKKATRAYLNEFSRIHDDVTLLRNPRALGYTQSANIGMKFSDAPFIILLNSDTVVSHRWALKLLQVANSGPEVGIVGPMSNAASWQSLPFQRDPKTGAMAINEIPGGMTVADMNRLCEQHGWLEHFPRVPLVNGFCYGIKREVLDAIGYFDDAAFPIGYGEEDDFSMRALDAGFVHALATHCYVFHAKSKSFGKGIRRKLARAGGRAIRDRHGESRVSRAFETMKDHPELRRIRIDIGRACRVDVNETLQTRLSLPAGFEEHENTPADGRIAESASGAARSASWN